jgi:hypothetical protein
MKYPYLIIEMLENGVYEQHHYPSTEDFDFERYYNKNVLSFHMFANEEDQQKMSINLRKMRDES